MAFDASGITDIRVTLNDPENEKDDRITIQWNEPDGRLHFWCTVQDHNPEPKLGHKFPVLYKNSIPSIGEPGYFHTRLLDASSTRNKNKIAHVLSVIEAGKQITKVVKKRSALALEKRAEQHLARIENGRIERLGVNHKLLLGILRPLLDEADELADSNPDSHILVEFPHGSITLGQIRALKECVKDPELG